MKSLVDVPKNDFFTSLLLFGPADRTRSL